MGLFFFDSSYRPIPLAQQYIGISEPNFAARNELLSEICYKKVVDSLRQGHQAMVFVHSRKDTVKTAQKLVDLARRYEDLEVFNNDTHPQLSLIKKDVMKSRNKDLIELFGLAVGVHHAGMLRSDRGLTERLFSEGLLKVLVCTATLAWGVNLPAHTVVIKGTQLYDPKAGGWRDLGMLDVMQIFGRAGRPQFDRSGEGIIITSHDKLAYYLRLLTSQLPIESQFISSLKDNLNAEVALGTVTNVKEACAWLGYTYLSIRMKLNPLAYGIGWDEVIADPSLSLKQRALVTDAARALDKAKMMRFDEKSGNFYCTELGRIASHFYIQYSSVETYNEMLRRHMNDSEVIEMVSHSSEFENIVVRDEEQNELETLLYISRGWIDTFSLVSDAAYISASLARIMRALFETCLRRGWCEMSLFMLEYCKAVDRQIWPHQHPLRQFDKELPAEILRKLEERGADLDRLQEMEEKDIGALIRYTPGGRLVKQYLGYFPSIQLSATIGLAITPEFTWKDRFHGAAQRWWIIVQDSESDHIYHSELFTLTKRMARGETQKLSFTVPIFEPHPPQYYIRAVSDSWLHAEAFYCISFHNLALPQARTSHTELLDLKPLPVTALGNNIYEALYNFSHFNPIQTQIFHILYHTDNNVLLGAPTGSGKTISAELAMLHLFNTQSDMKVVYIAPLKAIVRERMNDWKDRLVSQLGKEMVEMTGDYTPDLMALLSADIIISTPEKWDGISQPYNSFAGTFVNLQVIVSRMRYISSQTERAVRFIGLSTALANAGPSLIQFASFQNDDLAREMFGLALGEGYPGKFYCPRMNSMNKPAYAAICTHSPTKPVLIFVSSRRQTRLTALDLIQFAASDETPRQFLGMPEEDLQMVLSQVLVCTSTLAWGVNLPAHLVIIKGTEYYDGKTKRYVDFPITDILQMMGRAGRPQYDQHGKAVILVHEPKKSFYKKFLYEPFPVESSLRDQLHDHFNAEIVSGTIFHKEDAVHYLSWTYLFRRLAINPAYYGLEDTEAEGLSSYLSRLVQNTFEDLEDSGCVKMTEDSVEPTMLGTIASQYYLSYVTVSMFGSNIGPDTSLEVFLHILSGASEYDELPVRHNEDNHNEALSQRVRFAVDNNRLDDPHVKANLLFQAHFSRLDLPISDYVTDLKSVLDQSIRIIQAMIDICANSGWLSSSITCMHLLQMVMQGLWFEQDSAFWMLPCMNNDLLGMLRARGISTVQQLLDIPKENLQTDLQRFPRIQVKLRLQRRDIDGENSLTLNIRMDKMNSWKNTSRAFALRFPKIKDEAWWLVLGNTNTSELYALKRISFSDRLNTHMELPSGITTFQGMKLVVVSDCYLGFEQEHSIEALVEQSVI
ncbi:DExH-box ATP-dependent RNA helicase DExH14 [Citrus sinensis]|uniref:DExH-box ATP-dependent RNA helicase DExH14 n=1 Tax=Citrus sinensis TaxID=2711 RepID=A0ACB8LXD2_CITSI|nr:DExH-box ATP-dependent RNA helicase DExH14 [Citrus sinensis]